MPQRKKEWRKVIQQNIVMARDKNTGGAHQCICLPHVNSKAIKEHWTSHKEEKKEEDLTPEQKERKVQQRKQQNNVHKYPAANLTNCGSAVLFHHNVFLQWQ